MILKVMNYLKSQYIAKYIFICLERNEVVDKEYFFGIGNTGWFYPLH